MRKKVVSKAVKCPDLPRQKPHVAKKKKIKIKNAEKRSTGKNFRPPLHDVVCDLKEEWR